MIDGVMVEKVCSSRSTAFFVSWRDYGGPSALMIARFFFISASYSHLNPPSATTLLFPLIASPQDVTHPKMKKRIDRPRIILLDCPLEYKKAESATQLEVRYE